MRQKVGTRFAAGDVRGERHFRSKVENVAMRGSPDGASRAVVGDARSAVVVACVRAEDGLSMSCGCPIQNGKNTAAVEF